MTQKSTLKLTPAQRATVLGDPEPVDVELKGAECTTECGCFSMSRPAAVKIGPLVTEITWRSIRDELPDDGITVLVACAGEADAEQAFLCAGHWRFSDGHVAKRVYAWAHMPATPRAGRGKKGGAS